MPSFIIPSTGGGGATDAAQVTYHNPTYPTVEAALDEVLYVPLTATLSHPHGVRLLGSTLATVLLSWSYNKAVTAQTVAGASRPIADRELSLPGANLTATTTYNLSASDGTTTRTASTVVRFGNDVFFGVASAGLAAGDLPSLAGTDRPGPETRARTFTVTAGATQKIYYAYPKRLGAGTFTVGGFAGGFNVREASYTNAAGYTETYYIYESASLNLGLTTVTVS